MRQLAATAAIIGAALGASPLAGAADAGKPAAFAAESVAIAAAGGDERLRAAFTEALASRNDAVPEIVAEAARMMAGEADRIAAAAAALYPDRADAIVAAAVTAVPSAARAIALAVAGQLPAQAGYIREAAVAALPPEARDEARTAITEAIGAALPQAILTVVPTRMRSLSTWSQALPANVIQNPRQLGGESSATQF